MEQHNLVPFGRGRGGRGRGFRRECLPEPPQPLEKLQGDTASECVSSQENQKISKIGQEGESCRCLANFVKLRRNTNLSVYQYHVSFEPELESSRVKRGMIKQMEQVLGQIIAFDGLSLHLPMKLHKDVVTFDCRNSPNNDSAVDVTVKIKFVKEKREPEDLRQFYSVLFQRILLGLGFVEIKGGFHRVSEIRNVERERLQVWPGVKLTVEVKDDGLMVMFDTPNRVLNTDTLYDFYKALRESDRSPEKIRETFKAYVVGKIVLCRYNNQCYKVDDINWELNPESTFTFKQKEITYKAYYKIQYNLMIKDNHQPLVLSKIKPRNVAHPNPPTEAVRMVALIPELCFLTGLTAEQRNNYNLITEIGAITRLNPRLRMSAMTELLKIITESTESLKVLADWGLELEDQPVVATGRKIENPNLMFHPSGESKKVSANFSRDACRSCYHPIPVTKYLVFCVRKDLECARNFVDEYTQACIQVGIKLRAKGEIVPVNQSNERIIPCLFDKALRENCTEANNIQFVVVILPSHREDVYRAVKKFCLTVSYLPSQCILSKTLRLHKSLKKVVMHVCLQINCKLGGSLWGLKLPALRGVMFVGMDAAHDPTLRNPSVIALVATMNSTCTAYFSRCAYQPIHQEVCTSLHVLFKDALDAYRQYNAGEIPEKIIFYRDGGSAGTFETLKRFEVDVCLEVLKEISVTAEKRVNFSYVCVAKRVPQRILLLSEGNNVVNPPPGTTLDHTITEPTRYDFYIVSQQAHHGTISPTHYSVVFETEETKPDIMQKVSYALTYMYFNCQGSIKVPAVIQYSHKLGQLVSRVQEMPNRVMSNNLYFL